MTSFQQILEHINTELLIPYARNSRTHSPEQVQQVANSIREFGFTNPVLIDGGNGIIAGHGRVMAAQSLGLEQVPCIRLAYLTDAQKRAYIIADNQLALNSGWDDAMLKAELQDLQAIEFDMSLMGFNVEFLEDMLEEEQPANDNEADAVPDVPINPVTKPGDVWLLGKHRLMCGDSTSINDIDILMIGMLADVCFTSPPYDKQRNYDNAKASVLDWNSMMFGVFKCLPVKSSCQILVNLGLIHKDNEWVDYWSQWIDFMRSEGWRRFGLYVWDQGAGLPGDWAGRLSPSFELIFHFNKESLKPNKWVDKKPDSIRLKHGTGFRNADGSMSGVASPEAGLQSTKIHDNIIRVNRQLTENTGHPAGFPVALPVNILKSYAISNDVIFEPFSGSGTTIIACEEVNCICHAMELSPNYVDMAVQRWQNFTGKQAVLEATGQTFDELLEAQA